MKFGENDQKYYESKDRVYSIAGLKFEHHKVLRKLYTVYLQSACLDYNDCNCKYV